AHNLYAQTAAELGTLGLLSLALTSFCFWRNKRETVRLYRDNGWEPDFANYVSRSAWLAVVLLLFMGAAGHNLYRYNWLWYGAFQAVALHCARVRAAEPLAETEDEFIPEPDLRYRYVT